MLPGQICLHNLSLKLSLERLDAGIINTLGQDIRRWDFETNVPAEKTVQRARCAEVGAYSHSERDYHVKYFGIHILLHKQSTREVKKRERKSPTTDADSSPETRIGQPESVSST
jgi:hypothetical protein